MEPRASPPTPPTTNLLVLGVTIKDNLQVLGEIIKEIPQFQGI